MKLDWRNELPMWILLALLFTLAAANWQSAPDHIAVHYGLNGQPDRWGGRAEGLLAMPLVSLGVYLAMLFLPFVDPGRANYATFARTYAILRLLVLLVLAGIYIAVLLTLHGRRVDMAGVAPLLVGGLFILLGNMLGKIRPNWFVGIRNPWTLSSKESWTRTHRVGGWVFMAGGILFMTCALVRRPAYLAAVGVLFGIAVVCLMAYSYRVWRTDPDKVPPAGTSPAEP
ncbi:MAG TPA: SdpI family protein [Candidatus Eisenbacteria bacterium]|jgi:uncharacterized membrane protein|nr:SdpI family protein [Candidatus Eisenbacteria bacterium]